MFFPAFCHLRSFTQIPPILYICVQMQHRLLETYHRSIQLTSEALKDILHRNDAAVTAAIDTFLACKGKIIFSGIGKSFYICQKLSATFNSTGSAAAAMHAGEALHGDAGMCKEGDVAVFISKSGTTAELLKLQPLLKNLEIPIVGIIGNMVSPLAKGGDIVLDASVQTEADGYNMVPTTSTSVALAMGDALAMSLMEARGFGKDDFAKIHPGGQLGKNLLHVVAHYMHPLEKVATAHPDAALKEVIVKMTEYPLGIACIVSESGLEGIITEGDIRRFFVHHDDIKGVTAADLMMKQPVTIAPDDTIMQAIELMENRSSRLSVLPVMKGNVPVGVIRIHDVY